MHARSGVFGGEKVSEDVVLERGSQISWRNSFVSSLAVNVLLHLFYNEGDKVDTREMRFFHSHSMLSSELERKRISVYQEYFVLEARRLLKASENQYAIDKVIRGEALSSSLKTPNIYSRT